MPPAEPPVVGVLALQGDVGEHLRALEQAGARPLAVRGPATLDKAAGLVIPGGESTTIWKLAEISGLAGSLRKRVAAGMPVFGSCAGMIMLAGRLEDPASRQETQTATCGRFSNGLARACWRGNGLTVYRAAPSMNAAPGGCPGRSARYPGRRTRDRGTTQGPARKLTPAAAGRHPSPRG
jgi:putative intracellular protease/amidase